MQPKKPPTMLNIVVLYAHRFSTSFRWLLLHSEDWENFEPNRQVVIINFPTARPQLDKVIPTNFANLLPIYFQVNPADKCFNNPRIGIQCQIAIVASIFQLANISTKLTGVYNIITLLHSWTRRKIKWRICIRKTLERKLGSGGARIFSLSATCVRQICIPMFS